MILLINVVNIEISHADTFDNLLSDISFGLLQL